MYLRSVNGNILYKGNSKSIKNELESALSEGIPLHNINLRNCNLSGIDLDHAQMSGACFWGSDLSNANIGYADISGSDFRTANLTNSCLAYSDCSNSDFCGAYFNHTIVANSTLENSIFSCPSVFAIDLSTAKTLEGAIYKHLGEIECDLSRAPLVVKGLEKQIILMKDSTLIGTDLRQYSTREEIQDILNRSLS